MILEEQAQEVEKQPEYNGIFRNEIDRIMWLKDSNSEQKQLEYYVKYKGYSYLHCEWVLEKEILGSKNGKNKLNRFKKVVWPRLILEHDF